MCIDPVLLVAADGRLLSGKVARRIRASGMIQVLILPSKCSFSDKTSYCLKLQETLNSSNLLFGVGVDCDEVWKLDYLTRGDT